MSEPLSDYGCDGSPTCACQACSVQRTLERSERVNEQAWADLAADGGLPESQLIAVPAAWFAALQAAQPVLLKVAEHLEREAAETSDTLDRIEHRVNHGRGFDGDVALAEHYRRNLAYYTERAQAVRAAILPPTDQKTP